MTWVGWIGLVVFGILALGCFLAGGTIYATAVGDWTDHGYLFDNVEMAVDWVFGLVGAAVIAAGIVLTGICLRILRWPLASLGLAVLSALFLIATFLIYSRTGNGEGSFAVVLLQGLCILGLFLLSLPPFLHWWFASRRHRPEAV